MSRFRPNRIAQASVFSATATRPTPECLKWVQNLSKKAKLPCRRTAEKRQGTLVSMKKEKCMSYIYTLKTVNFVIISLEGIECLGVEKSDSRGPVPFQQHSQHLYLTLLQALQGIIEFCDFFLGGERTECLDSGQTKSRRPVSFRYNTVATPTITTPERLKWIQNLCKEANLLCRSTAETRQGALVRMKKEKYVSYIYIENSLQNETETYY